MSILLSTGDSSMLPILLSTEDSNMLLKIAMFLYYLLWKLAICYQYLLKIAILLPTEDSYMLLIMLSTEDSNMLL